MKGRIVWIDTLKNLDGEGLRNIGVDWMASRRSRVEPLGTVRLTSDGNTGTVLKREQQMQSFMQERME